MKRRAFLWLTLCLLLGNAAGAATLPEGFDRQSLLSLRAEGFVIADSVERSRFALELLDCLSDPDPEIRDRIAYEGITSLLRNRQLSQKTVRTMMATLIQHLSAPGDEGGFRRPFAALALAEVARTDRIDPWLSDAERSELVAAAAAYATGITDYRGFDESAGWRHAVAHAADLLMQLALNPGLERGQLLVLRQAVASQISPARAHFYIYGEGERLARPVLFIALRGVLSEQDWSEWFTAVGSPTPFDQWGDAFGSQMGLARIHNVKAFMQAIYVNASASTREELAPLQAASLAVLSDLP